VSHLPLGRADRARRLWETVRHLRPIQVYGRLWFRLYRPHPGAAELPALTLPGGVWAPPARREPSLIGPGRLRLLGETGEVRARRDWDDPARAKLWRYHLHYFDDLNAEGAAKRRPWQRDLIARWVADNPPFSGTGWEPYPTSLRLCNWLKWGLAGNPVEPAWAESLALQARWLRRRLEWHLLGNHLLANAKALVFAGTCCAGAEAGDWLATGLRVLARELPRQVLDDGGHCERSPMYHALVLEDLLDLTNLLRAAGGEHPVTAILEATATRMGQWLAALCHPDGQIALVNDAAFGQAPAPVELAAYARRLALAPWALPPVPAAHLAASGYVRLSLGPALAILDVGEVGPDYLPGHAHADTLSFELSLHGRRLIVDSGTSVYGEGPERQRQRGTAAHNTLTIDGADSSEVWGGFRVARRARPQGLTIDTGLSRLRVACAHDGYRRLPGRPVHRRVWTLTEGGLIIEDQVAWQRPPGPRPVVARLHLHPEVEVRVAAGGMDGWLDRPGADAVAWRVTGAAEVRVVATSYHPRFGACAPSRCIEIACGPTGATTRLTWAA
jgi:uncharacterized heparinase superfamily protein